MAQSLEELERFSIPGAVSFWGDDETGACIHVANGRNSATVYLFGAQPIMWQPNDQDDVLWLSEDAQFDLRTPIRGGIPVCWPWFGGHPAHPEWPSHGFARTALWQLDGIERSGADVVLRLSLPLLDAHQAYWPHQSRPSIAYTIGETLAIELTTTNIDPQPIRISQALHNYFEVSDIADISITALEASAFIDKLTGREEPASGAPIIVSTETDRIYRHPAGPIRLHDNSNARTITIAHEGATSAIIWNPWIDKSARLDDIGGPEAYRGMVCIETGNVAPDGLLLEPGETHTLKTTISLDQTISLDHGAA